MKECKPSFEKCIIDRCPYYHEFIEIVSGDVHMRIRCEKQDISLTNRKEEERRMTRLIDADALIKRLDYCVSQGLGSKIAFMFKDMVDEAPTVDAVPVRHGEFIGTEYDGYADGNPVYYEWKCSECGCIFEDDEPTYKYCPNCGARMDAERKEE